MKSLIKIFLLLFVTATVFTACSKDDDPADNDLFVGTYKGDVGYISGETTISAEDGSVTVVKTGDDYYFRFSNNIPDLKGVEFRREGDNVLITVGDDEAKYIRIDASSLVIRYTNGDAAWSATCER